MAAASPRAVGPARVIFLGPPGAGKGTQAVRLAAHRRVPRISTGDMLRAAIAGGTSLGQKARPLMERGRLVPDPLLVELVRERIGRPDCRAGFVLDGFPRTLGQAQGLEAMGGDPRSYVVVDFAVPRQELVRRIGGRRWCPRCQATFHLLSQPPARPDLCDGCGSSLVQRHDDSEPVVARRLREYETRTSPLLEYYRTRARVVAIDAHRPMDVVFCELLAALEVCA